MSLIRVTLYTAFGLVPSVSPWDLVGPKYESSVWANPQSDLKCKVVLIHFKALWLRSMGSGIT